ncbi:MAG: imidazoleglycerol-phosphate dehydratase HisB [Candidatus Marinimicrobia bacterium]|nr:imidazoleglycerol-phosphate dehydratase HisB [Candidatus Neomarinimicrobiota bacterium]MCF7827584.1 imidazoleglycerol-phosphate dehydratase HisB [Candidatus Neomarinimicrobiota bacterium]MCF7881554.1 imidazoleglycerol-phosphate dehydratase HisB [Candidatus Neomarinimicrobiota bacterium]
MRKTTISRSTRETTIEGTLNLDGSGKTEIRTGIPYLDHMLTLFGFHGNFDLEIDATGDLSVDDHHTVEDVGIVIGQALDNLLGEQQNYVRYGSFLLPMDEVLARVVLDLSGRAYLKYNVEFSREKVGDLSTENVLEFFRALVRESRMTLHIDMLESGNAHHQIEVMFKAFGRALREAVQLLDSDEVASTKGTL